MPSASSHRVVHAVGARSVGREATDARVDDARTAAAARRERVRDGGAVAPAEPEAATALGVLEGGEDALEPADAGGAGLRAIRAARRGRLATGGLARRLDREELGRGWDAAVGREVAAQAWRERGARSVTCVRGRGRTFVTHRRRMPRSRRTPRPCLRRSQQGCRTTRGRRPTPRQSSRRTS